MDDDHAVSMDPLKIATVKSLRGSPQSMYGIRNCKKLRKMARKEETSPFKGRVRPINR
jgi:hypothetical protein